MNDLTGLKDINELTELILSDYGEGRAIDKMDVFSLPSKSKTEQIVDELFEVIYPGYYHKSPLKMYNPRHTLAALVEDIAYNLKAQVAIVLGNTGNGDDAEAAAEAEAVAEDITAEFIRRIPMVRDKLEKDVEAFYQGDPAAEDKAEIIASYPGLYAVTVYRLAHELVNLGVPVLPRIMTEYAHAQTGVDIHPGAEIGEYFFIDHGTGVVIGETTIIGNHVKMYQGVTLGGLSTSGGQDLRGSRRHPTIEDNVTIYSGASILGGNTIIGHDSVIGGSAFITKSVPPYTRIDVRNQEHTMGSKPQNI
ncbi:MAG: serine acetyltransferase [Firmicutes bacterium]|nr:serine acetyltransferase [Bacillota bacterium]